MTLQSYIIIFIITLIIQFYSRFTYLSFKHKESYAKYAGSEIGYFILKDHQSNATIKAIKNSNNYELYNFQKGIIYLKKSVFHKTGITSISLAAQRTFMYLKMNNLFGHFRMALEQFIEVCIQLGWIIIAIGLVVQNESVLAIGIVTLFLMFIYNLIYLPFEITATISAYDYLKANIIEEYEYNIVKKVLINNLLFFVTNYSQPIFDLFYYILKAIIHKLKKVKS